MALSKIDLLDHGYVRLIDSMGNDLSIVRAARVSYDADWRAGEDAGSDAKLIRYLWKHKHTSPFEAVQLTFEIKAPIFVVRQWHRHRTWAYNEVSARYTELPEEFYVPELENITTQSKSNKQARTQEQHPHAADFQMAMREHCLEAFALYKTMLEDGCPRELARTVLPLATYTRYFGSVSLRNLFHFLELRWHPHSQWEIVEYARAMWTLAKEVCPIACDAWLDSAGSRE